MRNLRQKKQLIEAETEKIKVKTKATVQKKTHEEKIIIAIGRWSTMIIATIGTVGAIWIGLWKVL